MKNLFDAGYESDQINQILKIQETGFNITKHITPAVSTEKLRKLREIFKDEYKTKEKTVITKFMAETGQDISSYVKKGITLTCQIRLIEEAKAAGYDENLFKPEFDFIQMSLLYKYLKKGIDITKYLEAGKTESYIEKISLTEKVGITYEQLSEFETNAQQEAIFDAAKFGVNPLPYITNKHTAPQIKAIVNAIRNKVDVDIVKKLDVPGSVMEVITTGLLEGHDITPFLTKDSKRQNAEVLLKCMREGIDASTVAKYEDHKIAKLAIRLNKQNLPIVFLDNKKYNYQQLSLIATAYECKTANPDIDVEKLLDPEYPVEQMRIILNLMLHKKRTDNVTIKNVSEPVLKIIEKNNLKDEYLDGLIHSAMDSAEINAIIKLKKLGYKISK